MQKVQSNMLLLSLNSKVEVSYRSWYINREENDLRFSSSLNGPESALSSGRTEKPVKEKPKLALEARLRTEPLLRSSNSSFIWALLDFRMWAFMPPLGEAGVSRRLGFLESILTLSWWAPPQANSADSLGSLALADAFAAAIASTSWSDLVLNRLVEFDFSICRFPVHEIIVAHAEHRMEENGYAMKFCEETLDIGSVV